MVNSTCSRQQWDCRSTPAVCGVLRRGMRDLPTPGKAVQRVDGARRPRLGGDDRSWDRILHGRVSSVRSGPAVAATVAGRFWRGALTRFCHGLPGPPRIQAGVSDVWAALTCGNWTVRTEPNSPDDLHFTGGQGVAGSIRPSRPVSAGQGRFSNARDGPFPVLELRSLSISHRFLVCGPGRCLTHRFRFLGDRLRTRFR